MRTRSLEVNHPILWSTARLEKPPNYGAVVGYRRSSETREEERSYDRRFPRMKNNQPF